MNKQKTIGFTLIEVLVALVILAIAFTPVIKAIDVGPHNLTSMRYRIAAHWVAQSRTLHPLHRVLLRGARLSPTHFVSL